MKLLEVRVGWTGPRTVWHFADKIMFAVSCNRGITLDLRKTIRASLQYNSVTYSGDTRSAYQGKLHEID